MRGSFSISFPTFRYAGTVVPGPATLIGNIGTIPFPRTPPGTYIGIPLPAQGVPPPVRPTPEEEEVRGGNLSELLERYRKKDKRHPPPPPGKPWR